MRRIIPKCFWIIFFLTITVMVTLDNSENETKLTKDIFAEDSFCSDNNIVILPEPQNVRFGNDYIVSWDIIENIDSNSEFGIYYEVTTEENQQIGGYRLLTVDPNNEENIIENRYKINIYDDIRELCSKNDWVGEIKFKIAVITVPKKSVIGDITYKSSSFSFVGPVVYVENKDFVNLPEPQNVRFGNDYIVSWDIIENIDSNSEFGIYYEVTTEENQQIGGYRLLTVDPNNEENIVENRYKINIYEDIRKLCSKNDWVGEIKIKIAVITVPKETVYDNRYYRSSSYSLIGPVIFNDCLHYCNEYGYCLNCGYLSNGTDAFVSANAVVGGKIVMNFKVALSAEAAADPEARMEFNLESGKVISIPISNASLIDSEKNIYQFTLSVTSTQMDEKVTAQMKYSEGFTYPDERHSSVLADYSVNKYLSNLEGDARADNNTKLLDVISAMKNFGAYMDIYSGDTTSDFTPDDLSGEQITIEKFYNSRVDRSISGLTAKSASVTVGSLIDINIKYEITDDISKYTFRLDGRQVQPVLKNGMYCVTIPEISPRNYSRVYIVSVTDGQRTLSVEYSVLSYIKNKLNDSDVNLVNVCRAMYLYNEAITAYSSKDAGGPYNVYFGVDGIMEADLDENRIYYETDYWVKDRGGLSSYFNKETLEALQQKTVAELSDKTQLNGKEFYIEKNGPYSDGPDTLFTCGRITLAYPKKFGKLNSITFGPFDYDDVARGEITVDGTDYYVYCIRGASLSLYAGTFRINLSSD